MATSIKVTGFIPKELLNEDAVRMELLNALRAEGRAIRKDLEATVKTWNTKPKFEIKVSLSRSAGGYVIVGTDDEIYGYVNDGTKPHPMGPIVPQTRRRWAAGTAGGVGGQYRKAAKALTIPTGGTTPKTTPGKLTSRKGRRKGPVILRKSTKRFIHPGSVARDFTGSIIKKIEKTNRFQNRIDDAIVAAQAKTNTSTQNIG